MFKYKIEYIIGCVGLLYSRCFIRSLKCWIDGIYRVKIGCVWTLVTRRRLIRMSLFFINGFKILFNFVRAGYLLIDSFLNFFNGNL